MNLAFILMLVVSSHPSFGQVCSPIYNRLPDNTDISVNCGPRDIHLSIKVCPVYFANFNPSDLALNGKRNNTGCLGTWDNSTDTPLLNFTLLLDDSSSNVCGNIIQIVSEAGSGAFSQYSNVQTVIISGFVDSSPLTEPGLVSYSTNLHYDFSCRYPMQYLLNNTELLTSFGEVAVNSNNGSFISTLRMEIFTDQNFSTAVASNQTVFGLKQTIYVQVSSNNTTTSYNVYLDGCFATPSPLVSPGQNDSYNFFTGCSSAQQTSIIARGVDKFARFSFKSFRFVQHSGQPASTIYLHCFTRLCLPGQCPTCSGSRRKRGTNTDSTTDSVVISLGPLLVSDKASQVSSVSSGGTYQWSESQTSLLMTLIIALVVGLNFTPISLKCF
ncbi:zona pellucida-like domain-containing protein 1 [Lithobates pipiens]